MQLEAVQVPHRLVLVTGARVARLDEQLNDAVDCHAIDAGRGAKGVAFAKALEDGNTVGKRQLIHNDIMLETGRFVNAIACEIA